MIENPEQKARELKLKQQASILAGKYQKVFSTQDGQVILADLMATFGLLRPVFKPVKQGDYFAYDPLTAALTDGGRAVIIYIREKLEPHAGEEKPKPKVIR
jgi:hypothetical protein